MRPSTPLLVSLALSLAPAAIGQCDQQPLNASSGQSWENFGFALDLEGTTAVVGARFSPGPYGEGRAFVFDAVTGQELHVLAGSDAIDLDYFGHSVAVHGSFVLVGAPRFGSDQGAAYLFDLATGQELFKLQPNDTGPEQDFGISVGFWEDLAVVGAPRATVKNKARGAVYLFDTATGRQRRKIVASDGEKNDYFGSALAVGDDFLVAGAGGVQDLGEGSGAAYVFDLRSNTELYKLTASDGLAGDGFGGPIDIHAGRALIAAVGKTVMGYDNGAAYLFDLHTGQEVRQLIAANPQSGELMGTGIALTDELAFAGAIFKNEGIVKAGTIHVFDPDSGVELFRIAAPQAQHSAQYGSVRSDGQRLLTGARWQDGAAPNSGMAWVATLDSCAPGVSFCTATANSTGKQAAMDVLGSDVVDDNMFALIARDLPPFQLGAFLASQSTDFVPFFGGGQGNLCLGVPFQRLNLGALSSGPAGRLSSPVNLKKKIKGGVLPGDTWYFQAWFRDAGSSNTSDGTGVLFK